MDKIIRQLFSLQNSTKTRKTYNDVSDSFQQCIITTLPSSAEIDETETSETLLHSMTVTDGEPISCSIQSVKPDTNVFQVKETAPGSSGEWN